MMKFRYNIMQKSFENKYNFLCSDTYSLVCSIPHDEISTWVKQNREHFDLSDSNREDMKDATHKKKLGHN